MNDMKFQGQTRCRPACAARRRALVAGLGAGLGCMGITGTARLHAAEQPAAGAALRLGLAPWFAPAATMRVFKRMRDHLAAALGGPVETFTARDLRAFAEKLRARDYDLALSPAHIGRLAILSWGYLAIATTPQSRVIQLLVRSDSRLRSAADLRGARIGGWDRLSAFWLRTVAWLQTRGLEADRDYAFVAQPSLSSALYALDRGDIDAAPMVVGQLQDMPPGTPRNYRVLEQVDLSIVAPIYIARADLPAAHLERIRKALLSFQPDPALPMTASNTPLLPITLKDLDSAEPEMQIARRMLALPP